jgi:hypothetical protein
MHLSSRNSPDASLRPAAYHRRQARSVYVCTLAVQLAAACTIALAVSRTHMCTPRATPSPSDLPSTPRTYVFLTCTRTGDETAAPPRGVEPAGHRVVVDGGDVRSAEINRRVSSIAGPECEKSRDAAGRS